MLNHLHIENYKCLRDVTVELGDFTVLIGSNDSGKSSLLEVIQRLGELTRQPYNNVFGPQRPLNQLLWRKESDRTLVWEVGGKVADATFSYHIELTTGQRPAWEWLEYGGKRLFWTEEITKPPPDSQVPPGAVVHVEIDNLGQQRALARPEMSLLAMKANQAQAPYLTVASVLRSCRQYRLDLAKLRQPSVPLVGEYLDATGANLAGVLDVLHNSPDPAAFDALQKVLRDAIPSLLRIVLPAASAAMPDKYKRASPAGAKSLEFVLAGDSQHPVAIPACQASDGALVLTAFLALLHGNTPNMLLIEEPQNAIHTSRLQLVLDVLRKISTGAVDGRKRQVIITTHSPMLMSYAKADEVRVFVRHPELGTQVKPMQDVSDIDQALNEFAVA